MSLYAAADIGGTKTAVALFSGTQLIAKDVFPTNGESGADNLVQRIGVSYRRLLDRCGIKAHDIAAAGVGCPGPLDLKNGRIVHIATIGFHDVPIKAMLERELDLQVFLENDANCAALAEAVIGAGKDLSSLAYVTVSTGIGCGIVVNGSLLDGVSDCAGELGHLTVMPGGIMCPCGKRGCLERYSSGTAIANAASEALDERLTTKDVFDRARSGDEVCVHIIEYAADRLAFGLSAICQIIDPGVIALGGSVLKNADIFMPLIRNFLAEYANDAVLKNTRLCVSELDGDQVLYGAAIYAKGKKLDFTA